MYIKNIAGIIAKAQSQKPCYIRIRSTMQNLFLSIAVHN